MIGTVEVTFRITFKQEVTKQEVRNFIDEMDHTINDTTGKVSIFDAVVISDDLDDRQGEDDETLENSIEEEANRRDIKNGLYGPEYDGEKL